MTSPLSKEQPITRCSCGILWTRLPPIHSRDGCSPDVDAEIVRLRTALSTAIAERDEAKRLFAVAEQTSNAFEAEANLYLKYCDEHENLQSQLSTFQAGYCTCHAVTKGICPIHGSGTATATSPQEEQEELVEDRIADLTGMLEASASREERWRRTVAASQERIRELEADSARLNYAEKHYIGGGFDHGEDGKSVVLYIEVPRTARIGADFRRAIDNAIAEETASPNTQRETT